ncbi:MAG: hypothetical protein NTZ17_22435 [Phycisphaerae bacterium]|nr:hypothetical protein [Phycisphaerae bacterium]
MFGKKIHLFTIFGFKVGIDPRVGIVTLKDMLKFLNLKIDLEGE